MDIDAGECRADCVPYRAFMGERLELSRADLVKEEYTAAIRQSGASFLLDKVRRQDTPWFSHPFFFDLFGKATSSHLTCGHAES